MRTLSGERRGSLERRDRPHRDGRRARGCLGQRLAAPLTDPDAIARRLDAVALFVARRARRARMSARSSPPRRTSRARWRGWCSQRGGPRDLAAIRDGLAAAGELARRLAALEALPDEIAAAAQALAAPDAAIIATLSARARRRSAVPEARRRLRARRLRRGARRDARAARRIAPRGRGAAGALRRRDRRARAESAPQQRARLFRRGDRAARREAAGRRRSTRPSSIARRLPARCASPPPSLPRWRRRSRAPPTARSRWSWRSSTGSPRR